MVLPQPGQLFHRPGEPHHAERRAHAGDNHRQPGQAVFHRHVGHDAQHAGRADQGHEVFVVFFDLDLHLVHLRDKDQHDDPGHREEAHPPQGGGVGADAEVGGAQRAAHGLRAEAGVDHFARGGAHDGKPHPRNGRPDGGHESHHHDEDRDGRPDGRDHPGAEGLDAVALGDSHLDGGGERPAGIQNRLAEHQQHQREAG